jgi:predicted negative regulator of RcsB-dependent stress response
VLSEQGKHDDALKLLDVTKAGAFGPLYHEARGDVLAAKGDAAGARQAYEAALAATTTAETAEVIDRQFVELKRDALPAPAPVPAPAAAATPVPAPATGSAP